MSFFWKGGFEVEAKVEVDCGVGEWMIERSSVFFLPLLAFSDSLTSTSPWDPTAM